MNTAALRTSVRPLVTILAVASSIVASFYFGNPEFLYGMAASAFSFWFADRAKESEAQRLAYGAAQDRSNIAAVDSNIKLLRAQHEFPSVPTKPVEADAVRPPLGYRTIS